MAAVAANSNDLGGTDTGNGKRKLVLIVVCIVLFVILVALFVMAHTVPAWRAQHSVPPRCDVVLCERGRGRVLEQLRLVRKYMGDWGDVKVLAYNGASGQIAGAQVIVLGAFVSYHQAAIDAAAHTPAHYIFLGDQVFPTRQCRIAKMYSASGKLRFFGGDDTDETDAAFSMYNETIAPVVVFDRTLVPTIDDEYIYRLHFSGRLRHAIDMAADVYMMRDADMNRTQVELARDSQRAFVTFHLPNESHAKITSAERAEKNAELIALLSNF